MWTACNIIYGTHLSKGVLNVRLRLIPDPERHNLVLSEVENFREM